MFNNTIPNNNYLGGISSYMQAPMEQNMPEQMYQEDNMSPPVTEVLRQLGGEEDTVLAHINPLEAMLLKSIGGSGNINPITGLPQFSLWSNPLKAIKSVLGGGGGAILGNMLLPGLGGVIGGALGQGLQNKTRGKSFMQGALKGGLMGAALPGTAGLLGQGANSLGFNSAGNFLTNYGSQNSIMTALGMGGAAGMGGASAGAGAGAASGGVLGAPSGEVALSSLTNNVVIPQGAQAGTAAAVPQSFMDKLMTKSGDFFSNPLNIIATGSALGALANRPKEKSPEKKAQEQKRYQKGLRLTPSERAELEADLLASRQMERRIARNQYLPEERFTINPLYRMVNNPEEYRRSGNWFNYHNSLA